MKFKILQAIATIATSIVLLYTVESLRLLQFSNELVNVNIKKELKCWHATGQYSLESRCAGSPRKCVV